MDKNKKYVVDGKFLDLLYDYINDTINYFAHAQCSCDDQYYWDNLHNSMMLMAKAYNDKMDRLDYRKLWQSDRHNHPNRHNYGDQ
jgi:hypothetical protein